MEEMRGLRVGEKELSQAQLRVSHTERHTYTYTEPHRHIHNT